ncbi:MAG: EpsI family protein [Candidatus Hydrogenedentes bacterium]|nr:EpsI family protein [Candidatus Hydrogenedentota bacterium]
MTAPSETPVSSKGHDSADGTPRALPRRLLPLGILFSGLYALLYWRSMQDLYLNWTLTDSYYTHGFLVPFISLYFVWRDRRALAALPAVPSPSGPAWILFSGILLLAGEYLGFRVIAEFSMIPMLTGICLVLLGGAWTRRLWFPILFLLFMIPVPPSMTQNLALQLKLTAAHSAVVLANLLTLPMVQDGSWVHFGNDRLLVGDICGGLRSLIALLALGAVFAYISAVRDWARVIILLMAAPIAVAANVVRIFFLCVVGYFWGSEVAGGKVHDYSGILIFGVAILLFSALELPLRRIVPRHAGKQGANIDRTPAVSMNKVRVLTAVALGMLGVVILLHFGTMRAQSAAHLEAPAPKAFQIPAVIVDFKQEGLDYEVDERTKQLLETSTILMRTYRAPNGRPVLLSIVHAGNTRRSLHFPEVCLVGDGWEIIEQENVAVGILFTARRLVLMKGDHYEAVLYWFKTGDEVTGDFFLNAFHWTRNQITFDTPTSAMIKVSTPLVPGGEAAAFSALEDFATKFAPIMMSAID